MAYPNNIYLPSVVAIPSSLDITAITQANPMVISVVIQPVTEANTYMIGQLIRLTIPRSFGMWQADRLTPKIINIGIGTITVNVDSSLFDPFIVPAITAEQPASLAPSGSQNLPFSNTTRQLAFQSLNDIGN